MGCVVGAWYDEGSGWANCMVFLKVRKAKRVVEEVDVSEGGRGAGHAHGAASARGGHGHSHGRGQQHSHSH